MLYGFFSRRWSGLACATGVAALGWAAISGARWLNLPWFAFIGFGLAALAALMASGALVSLVRLAATARKHPPPGRMVDVGGYRMHILGEGENRDKPAVVWIPGAHGEGLTLHHLHTEMRRETRSILFDRPGSGWSSAGPGPRRSAREAAELATLLKRAGEPGPFVVVGHSYGGLLAANFARRNLDKVAGLVLLDATPPDSFYGSFTGGDAMAQQIRMNASVGLAKRFGLQIDPYRSMAKKNPQIARLFDQIYGQLAAVRPQLDAHRANPTADLAAASIYAEFAPQYFRRHAMDLVVYDGELTDVPVFVCVPEDEVAGPDSEANRGRAAEFLSHARRRYLATSSRSRLVHAPTGSSHNFVFEQPQFVLGLVRQALAGAERPA